MTRKSATEPIQDNTLVEEAQVTGVSAHTPAETQVGAIHKVFTREARLEELTLIFEGAQSAKNKILLQVEDSIKQLKETLNQELAKYDNIIARCSEEYKSLTNEDTDDKES